MWISLFIVGILSVFFVLFITQDFEGIKEPVTDVKTFAIKDGRWTFANKTYDELNKKEREILGEHIAYEYEIG